MTSNQRSRLRIPLSRKAPASAGRSPLPRKFFIARRLAELFSAKYKFRINAGFRDQRGVIGIIGMAMYSAIVVVVGATMVASSVGNLRISQQQLESTQSIYNAESGAEDGLIHIKRSASYGSSTVSLDTDFGSGDSTEIEVSTVSTGTCGSAKQIIASGFADDLVRRIRLSSCPTPSADADFVYAIQAGTGGINMNNNAVINGVTYSNGNHTAGNNASVSGDVWVAGGATPNATPAYEPSGPTEFQFGRSTSPNVIDMGQSFTADTSESTKLIKVSLLVKKFGSPSNATVRIVTDNANKPSSTQVASGTLNSSSVGSTLQFIDVSMSTPPTLTDGTKYWIVIDTSSSSSNYWAWGAGPDSGYANNKGMSSPQWRSSGSMTWNNANADFGFKAFMGSPPTSVSGLSVGGDVHANTITNNTVAGDAYYQTNSGSTVAGSSFPGSTDPPQRDLPITDAVLTDFKNQAAAGTLYSGNYTVPLGETRTIGPVKIDGNLILENGSTLILRGTVWVTGTMNFSNNSHIELDSGYESASGAMIGDGTITISNNVAFEGSGAADSFLLLASSSSGTGIDVSNNATNVILAAPNGTIFLQNNAGANALTANRLELSNNAVVNYVSGLADIDFSGGPGGSFNAGGWHEVLCPTGGGACTQAD